jgi:hypothetical protein
MVLNYTVLLLMTGDMSFNIAYNIYRWIAELLGNRPKLNIPRGTSYKLFLKTIVLWSCSTFNCAIRLVWYLCNHACLTIWWQSLCSFYLLFAVWWCLAQVTSLFVLETSSDHEPAPTLYHKWAHGFICLWIKAARCLFAAWVFSPPAKYDICSSSKKNCAK